MQQGAISVVEETKQQFVANFIVAGVPVVEEYANEFVAKVKEQSARSRMDEDPRCVCDSTCSADWLIYR